MKRVLLRFLLCLVLVSTAGCAEFSKAWPVVKTVIDHLTDADQILNIIDTHVRAHFRAHPNPEQEAVYDREFLATLAALNVATRITQGDRPLSQAEGSRAFDEFRVTFVALRKRLLEYGLMQGDGTLSLSAAAVPIIVPEPLALQP